MSSAPAAASTLITDFNAEEGDKIDLTGIAGVYSVADLTVTQHGARRDRHARPAAKACCSTDVAGETLTDDLFLFAPDPGNQAPVDIELLNWTIEENAAVDTVVGTLAAVDPDLGDTFTYELLDDAGGLFAIAGDTLVVAGALDFETAAAHVVTVRATDSAGNIVDKNFAIDVADGNDTIVGSLGSEVMTGGGDADTFVFQAVQSQAGDVDTITDFVVGVDYLQFDGLSVVEQTEADVDGDLLLDTALTLDDGAVVQLLGISNVNPWELMA